MHGIGRVLWYSFVHRDTFELVLLASSCRFLELEDLVVRGLGYAIVPLPLFHSVPEQCGMVTGVVYLIFLLYFHGCCVWVVQFR